MIVSPLEQTFNYNKMLEEFLSFQPGHQLSENYQTAEVFNRDYSNTIKENCPYTIEVCETLKLQFKYNFVLFRSMAPHSTLSWHKDSDCDSVSYHIPIATNFACFYAYIDRLYPMQELGRLYSVLNQENHTFINAGPTPRVHLHLINDRGGQYLRRNFLG